MNRYAITLGAAIAVTGALATGSASAVVVGKAQYNQAVGAMCQGALPNYEGSFRKRPLAIKNEGTTAAFLTCGLNSQFDASTGGVPEVILVVTNRNAAATDVSCTLVDGYVDATIGFAEYFPLTVNVPAQNAALFDWVAAGGGGTFDPVFGFPALSCNVPANIEVNYHGQSYEEEVGA